MPRFRIQIVLIAIAACCSIVQSAAAIDIGTTSAFHQQRFEAWGTSLAWMGNELGGSSNTARRDQIMDLLFDQDNGLGLNFVRYNIGAGQNPAGPAITRAGGDVAGWVPSAPSNVSDPNTWTWDWNADSTQRWVLDAAIDRGVTQVEAFANSAPWWMTENLSSRGQSGQNLDPGDSSDESDPGNYDEFGHYLLEVTEHFENNLGIHFHSLAPMNEPGTGFWNGQNNQEGMNVPRGGRQTSLIREIGRQIETRGLTTGLVGPEETSTRDTATSLSFYGSTTRSYLSQINTHTYSFAGGSDLDDVQALVNRNNTYNEPFKIYATEFGTGGNSTPVSGGIRLANRITMDMNVLGAAGWTYWQAVEDNNGSNWGLLIAPFDGNNNWFNMRRQYYAMQQFSSHIRPGAQILSQPNDEVVAAYDPRTGTTTLVITNDDAATDQLSFDLLDQSAAYTRVIRTSDTESFKSLGPVSVSGNQVSMSAPENTITTVVVYHRPNLIQNAGFEMGAASNGAVSIPGWQAQGGGFLRVFDNTNDGSEAGALHTNNTANSGQVSQTGIGDAATDLTGMAFEFSLDVKFQNEGSDFYNAETHLAIEFYGADDQTLAHSSTDDHQTLIIPALEIDETQGMDSDYRTYRTARFVAPAGTRYVRPVIRYDNVASNSNNWVFFDNAYLQETHPVAEAREWTAAGSGAWSDHENWMSNAKVENNSLAYFGNAIEQASTVTINSTTYVKGLTFFSQHAYQLQGAGQLVTGHPTERSMIDARLGNHRISLDTSLVDDVDVQVLPGASLVFDAGLDLNGHDLAKLGGGLLDLDSGFEMGGGLITSYTTVDALIALGSDAVLDGDFQLLLAPGETLELGDAFELVSYSSLSDTFDNLLLPTLANSLAWDIEYGLETLVVEVTTALTDGDFNDDGNVDGLDFLAWQRDDRTAAELSEWQANYGTASALASSATVPEPNAACLLLLGSVLLTRSRTRLCLDNVTGRRIEKR